MPPRENIDEQRGYERREQLRASTVNALMERVKQRHAPHMGTYEAGAQQRQGPDEIWVHAPVTIPPYSIFGVSLDAEFQDPPFASGTQVGFTSSACGSLLAPYTNDATEIPAGENGVARPVEFERPVLATVSGTTPTVGSPCGVIPGEWGVTAVRQGFTCISEPDDDGRVWVVRATEPSSVIGEVTVAAAAYDAGTDTPGIGTLKVLYRRASDDVLVDAPDPATGAAPWLQQFFNLSSAAVPVEAKIRAESSTGVGLTVLESSGSSGSVQIGIAQLKDGDLLACDTSSLALIATTHPGMPSQVGDLYFTHDAGSGVVRWAKQSSGVTFYNPKPFKWLDEDVLHVSKQVDHWVVDRPVKKLPYWRLAKGTGTLSVNASGYLQFVTPTIREYGAMFEVDGSDNTKINVLCPVSAQRFKLTISLAAILAPTITTQDANADLRVAINGAETAADGQMLAFFDLVTGAASAGTAHTHNVHAVQSSNSFYPMAIVSDVTLSKNDYLQIRIVDDGNSGTMKAARVSVMFEPLFH
jgi:hypothetical protein